MASLYKKVIEPGWLYWYLREMGWVDGKPKMISERYVGTAAEVEALLDAREERMLPERTRHLDFGAVAAAGGCWPISAWPPSSTRRPGQGRPGCRCHRAPTWRWPR